MTKINKIVATVFAVAMLSTGALAVDIPSAYAGATTDRGANSTEAWAWADVWDGTGARCQARHGERTSDTGIQYNNNNVMAYANTGRQESVYSSSVELK